MHHRQHVVAAVAALGLLLSAGGVQAAAAPLPPSTDLLDAQGLVEAIAPSFVGAPGEKSELRITSTDESNAAAPQVLSTPADRQGGTGISIDYASNAKQSESGEFTVFQTPDSLAAAFVHPTYDGVQIITAIASRQAPDSYSYTLDVPSGSELVSAHDGLTFNLVGPDGERIGALAAPWALDSKGSRVPTSFEWSGSTLTQHVDLSDPKISYPVLADPDWQYGVDYSLGAANPGTAWTQLHSCFNCYFPIEGAPARYPTTRTDLPLVVKFGPVTSNFHCTMGSTYDRKPSAWGWYFTSATGHVDGLGSAIFFDIIQNKTTGKTRLWVSGMVHNDFPGGLPNPVYVAFATVQWQGFANNLSF